MTQCVRCNGSGKIPSFFGNLGGEQCSNCGGTGQVGVVTPPVLAGATLETYSLIVGAHHTMADAIAAGGYDRIGKLFRLTVFPDPPPAKGTTEIVLVHFGGRNVTSDEVHSEFRRGGLREAQLWEQLALGEQHPEIQRTFPVAALGSFVEYPIGSKNVVCLRCDWNERILATEWYELCLTWGRDYRFAGVRIPTP